MRRLALLIFSDFLFKTFQASFSEVSLNFVNIYIVKERFLVILKIGKQKEINAFRGVRRKSSRGRLEAVKVGQSFQGWKVAHWNLEFDTTGLRPSMYFISWTNPSRDLCTSLKS